MGSIKVAGMDAGWGFGWLSLPWSRFRPLLTGTGEGGFPGDPNFFPPPGGGGGGGYPDSPQSFPPSGGGMPGFGPAPLAPAPREGSSAWKFILVGCLGLVLLAVVIGGGTCYYLTSKGKEMLPGLMKLGTAEYMKQLSPDHTEEQKERFESLVNTVMADELKRLGFIEWAVNYQESMDRLGTISQDGEITVEESENWCEQATQTLEKAGYWKESEESGNQ